MKSPNRDLLVLVKDDTMSERDIELEVKKLNTMLMHVETSDSFLNAHEVIDLNKFQITRNRNQVRIVSKEKQFRSFIFFSNLN